jgi:hypothetical protein
MRGHETSVLAVVRCVSRACLSRTTAATLGAVVIAIALGCPTGVYGEGSDTICPPGSILSQPPNLGGADWNAFMSDLTPYYIRYEKFEGTSGWICGIRWWGFNSVDSGSGFTECEENPMWFEITFYQDAQGQPGAEICSYEVNATGTPVAVVNEWNLYQYDASLDSCCAVTDGWVSVVGLDVDPSCWFMWNSSSTGDDSACQRNAAGLTCGTGQHFRDLSVCLIDSPVSVEATTWGVVKSLYR